MKRPRILIAEDEPLLRAELKELLQALWPEVESVAEAKDGVQAIEAIATRSPDVLFLDIQMPGLSGIDVAYSTACSTRS
jgi:YesN/AraC family two-component response regulator